MTLPLPVAERREEQPLPAHKCFHQPAWCTYTHTHEHCSLCWSLPHTHQPPTWSGVRVRGAVRPFSTQSGTGTRSIGPSLCWPVWQERGGSNKTLSKKTEVHPIAHLQLDISKGRRAAHST